jgi:hypothetical protein
MVLEVGIRGQGRPGPSLITALRTTKSEVDGNIAMMVVERGDTRKHGFLAVKQQTPTNPAISTSIITTTPCTRSLPDRDRVLAKPFEDELISLAHVNNVDDFFRILDAREPIDPDSVFDKTISMDRTKGHQKPSFTLNAVCEPTLVTISENASPETTQEAIFPRCIKVLRCGGCCGSSDLLACTPTNVTYKEVKRARVRLQSRSMEDISRGVKRDSFIETVYIEEHQACTCQCRELKEHCDPKKHVYHENRCRCICNNYSDEEDCLTQKEKFWDNRDCSCRCKNVHECSTGLIFSQKTCRCELLITAEG